VKHKDGRVAFCSEKDGHPDVQWVGGGVQATDSSITVASAFGDQLYKLMDHITVSNFICCVIIWLFKHDIHND
jgi:hypothetical protein